MNYFVYFSILCLISFSVFSCNLLALATNFSSIAFFSIILLAIIITKNQLSCYISSNIKILFKTILLSCIFYGLYLTYDSRFSFDSFQEKNKSYLLSSLESANIANHITLRVNVVDINEINLEKFITHYAFCSVVDSIHILPIKKNFNLAVQKIKKVRWLFSESEISEIKTDAIMSIDSDILVSCSDLEYTYNVWSSAKSSQVGFFPRLITSTGNNDKQYEYLGPLHVWWHGTYSLMSSSAVMVKKSILESLYRNSIKAKLLWDKLSLFPQCSHLALPLWVVYNSDTPPVWVDADVSYIKLLGKVTVSNKGKVSSSDCLNNLASALSIKTFQHSSHKAAKAKNCLFW